MKVLGINYLSESSVALIHNGKIIYAISEERLNRIKNWWGNPYKAIDFVLKETKTKIKDIDYIATHGISSLVEDKKQKNFFKKKINEVFKSNLNQYKKKKQIKFLKDRLIHENKANNRNLKNIKELKKNLVI